ncbi:MAG TPA: hypothetical protein VK689_15410, partial [Armatimonadota bacterium]|nr:hypothetical protein [Armatimonadota bacterium]
MIPNRYRAGRTASPSPDECMVSITDDAPAVLVGRTAEGREVLEGQALTLARMARAQNVPVVINSFVARLFVRDLRPGSEAPVPKQPPVDRPPRYAQTDSRFRTTMEESGRANLVVLGVWARTPVVQPAIPALADVSEVYTASGAGTDGYTPGSSSNARVLPLLAAKLAPPVASPSLVPRPLLACRLNPEASTRLALLVAPAGSGKSSLVSQWRHDQEESDRTSGRRITWLSLDTADSDPARFLLYLCAALETVAPEAVGPVRALLQSSQPPSLQYALTLLLNALASLPQPVTVVLDDYHQIEANAVHESLTFLLEHLPPTLFFIITTRSDPPLPLARLRVRRQLIELRAGDLRFNDDEAATFLNESMGLSLAPRAVARLAERTEGWVAGLQLAALSLQGVAEPDRFLDAFTGSSRYVVDYLSEEVLRRQPPEVADFLRRTAILDRLCGPLCEAVTGAPGGQAMLERLEAANLFLIPLDAERRWYRYHHLFADVLRARLLPQLGEEAAALHERASAWLEAERMPADAIEHALSGGQYERAADLIERQCRTLWGLSAYASLEGWLKALPAGLIESRPQLSMALATLHYYYWRAPEAESVLDACRFDPCDESEESRDLRGRALALRG